MSYGLLGGAGAALSKIGDNLGQKMRDERLNEWRVQDREANQTFQTERDKLNNAQANERARIAKENAIELSNTENDRRVAAAEKVAKARAEQSGQTNISRLIAQRDALPEGDPNRKLYDAQITKLNAPTARANKRNIQKVTDDMGVTTLIEIMPDGTGRPVPMQNSGGVNVDLELEAEEYAESVVNDMAGTFSSDKSDFAKYGGSRTRAKQAIKQEYIRSNGGSVAPPKPNPTQNAPESLQEVLKAFKEDNPNASDELIMQEALKQFPQFAPKQKKRTEAKPKPKKEEGASLFSDRLADALLPPETQGLLSSGMDYVKSIPRRASLASKFQKEHGRYPTDEELAVFMAQQNDTAIAAR